MSSEPRLETKSSGLWTVRCPHALGPLKLGGAMRVMERADGTLLLHSPIAFSEALKAQVDALGEVSALLAPNGFHHLYIGAWMDAYPSATVYVSPALKEKRADLQPVVVLEGDALDALRDDRLDLRVIGGMPRVGEVAMLHRPSGTLILTDLLMNLQGVSGATAAYRWLFNLGPGQSPVMRLVIQDKRAYLASIREILAWDFRRISLCHNEEIEDAGPEVLERLALAPHL